MIREVLGVSAVDEATDGTEALLLAGAKRSHLVVLDIHMPREDGLAALPRLKSLADAPVVMVLTNDPSPRHRRRCALLGADLFFDKSAEFDRAIDVVAKLAHDHAQGAHLP